MEICVSDIEIEFLKKEQLDLIKPVNRLIFNEERIINTTKHNDLIILRACIKDITVGFKVGYGKKDGLYYSAKGGVLPTYRRMGLARKMLDEMLLRQNGMHNTKIFKLHFQNNYKRVNCNLPVSATRTFFFG